MTGGHQHGVKVMVSAGGQSDFANYAPMAKSVLQLEQHLFPMWSDSCSNTI